MNSVPDAHYYPETDSMIVRFSQRPSAETHELGEDILADYDADGQLIGLEILALKSSKFAIGE